HQDAVAARRGVGVSAADVETAAATILDGAGGDRFVAPVDCCAELVARGAGIGVGEVGHDRIADRNSIGGVERRAAGAERRVVDGRRAAGAGGAAPLVDDRNAQRVTPLVGVGVRAQDIEPAAAVGLDRAGAGAA